MTRRLWLAACIAATLAACSQAPDAPAPIASAPATPARPAAPAPAEVPAPRAETWALPGTFGPLTTQLELEQRFGKANVRQETFPGAEGIGEYPVLVVYPDDPRKRLELVLDADNPDAPVQELRVRSRDSLWHHASGLRPGMTLAQLVALNGAPVSFYGLGWDYGGGVQDWHGGTLANPVGTPVFHRVRLDTRIEASEAKLPMGDATYRSDDRRWPDAGRELVVAELGISWPDD